MKIVVTHVPAGAGHQRASEALVSAFHQLHFPGEVKLFSALEGMDPWYRWCFTRGYLYLIHRAPSLWGALYHLTDCKPIFRFIQAAHRRNNASHGKELEEIFLRIQPEILLGTHFFPMEVASSLKARGKLSSRLFTVITDYIPHALWVAPHIDGYFVGSQAAREYLMERGVRAQQIEVTGVPIDQKFSTREDRTTLGRKLGIDPGRFTILIGSGGSGTGPVVQLVQRLGRKDVPTQLIVVAGNNTTLFQSLELLRPRLKIPVKNYGFIHHMDELMDVSDLMISKAGGLTCAEALAKNLPLILAHSIPGQESRNARLLERWGCAIRTNHLDLIPSLVEDLRKNPKKLHEMSQKAKALASPAAALEIAKKVSL